VEYRVLLSKYAAKKLKKMDKNTSKRIYDFLKKIDNSKNPRIKGEALSHNLKGYWKYKPLKDYRVIVEIQDDKLIVLAIEIEHRSKVYLILNKLKNHF
jgi:addiction module toxin, relE/stbE family